MIKNQASSIQDLAQEFIIHSIFCPNLIGIIKIDIKENIMYKSICAMLLLVCATGAQAYSGLGIRCVGDLVTPGYLKYEVLKTCGEPLSREIVGEVEIFDSDRIYDRRYGRYKGSGSKVILYLEEWIYDRGGLHLLRFEGNRLVNFESIRKK